MTIEIDALIWHPYYITLPGNVPRCRYIHALVAGVIVVVDQGGAKSVEDDHMRVTREMYAYYTRQHPIVMRLGDGNWMELRHLFGRFLDYREPSRHGRAVVDSVQPFLP